MRAQELRFAWERFLADDDEEDPELVREAIADSWRRSSAAGVDPTGGRSRRSSPTRTRRTSAGRSTRSAGVAPLIHECLSAIADEAGYLIVVTRRQRHADDDRGLARRCACAPPAT